jgi:dihydrofolate reductase
MRRIVMFNQVSADGYFAASDGSLDWVVPDDELGRSVMEHGPKFDTVLFGRRTYDMFEQFWPHALDAADTTAPDPHAAGRRSRVNRDMVVFLNEAHKVVFSRQRPEVTWKNSRLVREVDPGEIDAMKRQPGDDMILFGSGSIVSELTRHRLIDEYQLVVMPVLLGSGRTLLGTLTDRVSLRLQEARPFASGIVLQRYALAR